MVIHGVWRRRRLRGDPRRGRSAVGAVHQAAIVPRPRVRPRQPRERVEEVWRGGRGRH